MTNHYATVILVAFISRLELSDNILRMGPQNEATLRTFSK
jgi:hypothetical protein